MKFEYCLRSRATSGRWRLLAALGGLLTACSLFDFSEPTLPTETGGSAGAWSGSGGAPRGHGGADAGGALAHSGESGASGFEALASGGAAGAALVEGGGSSSAAGTATNEGGASSAGGGTATGNTENGGRPSASGGAENAFSSGGTQRPSHSGNGGGSGAGNGSGGTGGAANSGGNAGSGATAVGGEGCTGSTFPANKKALDDFEQPGPGLASWWALPSGLESRYAVSGGALLLSGTTLNDIAEYVPSASAANQLGPNQEVWAKLEDWDRNLYGVQLWMKSGFVAVGYADQGHGPMLYITYEKDGHPDLVDLNGFTLNPPVVLGGRAYENGCVELYVDGEFIVGRYLGDGDTSGENIPEKQLYSRGGPIGIAATDRVVVAEFGGGTVPP